MTRSEFGNRLLIKKLQENRTSTELHLEDVGKDLETIDNYLIQLELAGKLKRLRGIIFGKMIKCIDRSGKKYSIRQILNDIIGHLRIPIIDGFPSGHRVLGDINVTLPFETYVTVDADKARIIVNEGGVS